MHYIHLPPAAEGRNAAAAERPGDAACLQHYRPGKGSERGGRGAASQVGGG